jgi:2-oxoglutarate ferredoxin oxidoreductase subunit beta
VELGNGVTEGDLLVHDENRPDPAIAYIMARMEYPQYPVPMGVFRAVERPTYEALMEGQIRDAIEREGEGDLEALLGEGDTWTVE